MKGETEASWQLDAAVKAARGAVAEQISHELGKEVVFSRHIMPYLSPSEYASRIVDYIMENKPTKSIDRLLTRLGY